MEIICRACNRSNQPGSLSCSNCGKRLLDENADLRKLLLTRRGRSNSGERLSDKNGGNQITDSGTVGEEPEAGDTKLPTKSMASLTRTILIPPWFIIVMAVVLGYFALHVSNLMKDRRSLHNSLDNVNAHTSVIRHK